MKQTKLQLETFADTGNSSFNLMFDPRLSDLFFWHFHPQYELVYIEGANGSRHVGDHISSYTESDLVLIGSNIPHLNWDYGVKTEYRKVVVHLNEEFVNQHLTKIPELSFSRKLIQQAKKGVVFPKHLHLEIGERLFQMEMLSPLEQYMQLLEVLRILSTSAEVELLHDQEYGNQYNRREQDRLTRIHAFIDQSYHRKIELAEIAQHSNLSKEAFCRYFKKMTSYTFVEFVQRYRISQAKRKLIAGESISTACFSSGFESLSYFNRIFNKVTGENPRDFKKRQLR